MKRVIAFDFLRGIAIIGVLLFHVFNIAYSQRADQVQAAIEHHESLEWYWYVIAIFLITLGAFNGMFLMISAGSNAMSVHKQWENMVVKNNMDKAIAFRKILKSQILRGAMIWALGFVSENIFATWLGELQQIIHQQPVSSFLDDMVKGFFFTNILNTIGISLIITSFIQLVYLKSGASRAKMSKALIFVAIACIALMPVMRAYVYPLFTSGTDTFSNDLGTITAGEIVARFFLAIFIGRITPLIPYFACAAIGLMLAINIAEKAITPEFLQKMLWLGLLFVAGSIPLGLAFDFSLGSRERNAFWMTFVLGLEIMSVAYIIYMVDFRRKTKTATFLKWTIWIRRFGVMTLTLWMLQYIMVFPVILIELITGWPMIGLAPGSSPGGLNDWQVWIVLLLLLGMWHVILLLWERVKFVGSFEWLTSLALSKGASSSGDRLNIKGILYETERVIEWVPGKKARNHGNIEP